MSSFQGIWVPIVTPFVDGAIDFADLQAMTAATQGTDCAPLVRVPEIDEVQVKRALDMGADVVAVVTDREPCGLDVVFECSGDPACIDQAMHLLTPGGTLMYHAHRAVESLTLDREVAHLRDELSNRYAEMVYNGFWFAPEREAIQALVTETQKNVSGEVRVKLYKGNIMNAGRRSQFSLYSEDVATMEGGGEEAYNQDDATGFIALNALRLKAGKR